MVRNTRVDEKIIEDIEQKLSELCKQHNTSEQGIKYLINYYIYSLGWTKETAIKYAISLFDNGTIDEIKIIGGGAKND